MFLILPFKFDIAALQNGNKSFGNIKLLFTKPETLTVCILHLVFTQHKKSPNLQQVTCDAQDVASSNMAPASGCNSSDNEIDSSVTSERSRSASNSDQHISFSLVSIMDSHNVRLVEIYQKNSISTYL